MTENEQNSKEFNFKYFNDHYGNLRGSLAWSETLVEGVAASDKDASYAEIGKAANQIIMSLEQDMARVPGDNSELHQALQDMKNEASTIKQLLEKEQAHPKMAAPFHAAYLRAEEIVKSLEE